jgi:ligand-binding sensor domain-containing protein
MSLNRRLQLLGAFGAAAVVAGFAGWTVWRAAHASRQSLAEVQAAGEFPFTAKPLDRVIPTGFDWISTPGVFTDAAWFQGHMYLAGRTALVEYDANGTLRRQYRVGLELPPAPLGKMAVGVAGAAPDQELYITTSGEGLLAFNGRSFRAIRPADSAHRKLTAVLPLSTGRILLGTESAGVLAFDGKRLTPFHSALAGLHVTALAGVEASLWIGALKHGVYHVHAGQIDRFTEGNGLPDPQVVSLEATADTVYAGTPLGVAEFRDGLFQGVLAQGFFASALCARPQYLLAGSLEEGIVEVPRTGRSRSYELAGQVQKLFAVDQRTFALTSSALHVLDPTGRTWRKLLDGGEGSLTDRNISALAVDQTGRLWVGYFDRGLDIIAGDKTRHLENDSLFCINRIVFDAAHGTAAVATANGLVLFDSAANPRQVLRRGEGLIADHVTDLVLRDNGMVAATPSGITTLDGSGAHSISGFHGLVNNHVYALGASGDEVLAGTLGGLSVLHGGLVRASYTTANSHLRHNWITAIVPVGREWFVGTYGGGIVRLDERGVWQSFADLKDGIEVNPNAMAVTAGRVYAGTLGDGLYVYDRGVGRWSAVTNGLPSANVTALAAANGNVYIGTDNGLVRVPERSIP